jgi:hypothetical protein
MNGLLICTGQSKTKNIGDYIQSLASELFFDKIDVYVEREKMDAFQSDEQTKVILNGWFMWNPDNWPPSKDIDPLFISFHIVPDVALRMLTKEGIEYLKNNAPIGCRDRGTMDLLQGKGIQSYFSGCLTLVLGERYKAAHKSRNIIFVDPYYEPGFPSKRSMKGFGRNLSYLVRFWKMVNRIERKKTFKSEFTSIFHRLNAKIERLWQISAFYGGYRTLFTDDVLLNAEYIKHDILQSDFKNDDEKLEYARILLRKYASAQLVITSRIHCALPCLGMETPVLFVTSDNLESDSPIRSKGRFGGLIELFHTLRYTTKIGVTSTDPYVQNVIRKGKIDADTQLTNKPDYMGLRDDLIRRCKCFVKSGEK